MKKETDVKMNAANTSAEKKAKNWWVLIFFTAILVFMWILSLENFLLFHLLVELFSIIIATNIFIIAWNSRFLSDNSYLFIIGIAYLFIGGFDLLHTLAYKGMDIINLASLEATQLWIATRYLESLSLLIAFLFFFNVKKPKSIKVIAVYVLVSALIIISIITGLFPNCLRAEGGLTLFKVVSEYVIVAILALVLFLLFKKRGEMSPVVFRWLLLSILFTMGAEIFFTFYISVYGISNVIGHFLKVISFWLIYKSIVKTGLSDPEELLFKRIKEETQRAQRANEAKTKLVSHITHDLKTPLNGILGLIMLLKYDETDAEKIELLETMEFSGENMKNLINDILDISALESGRLSVVKEKFSLGKLLKKLEDLYTPVLRRNGIDFNINIDDEIPEEITSDEKRMNQIITNLLGNAYKYTEEGTVSLTAYQFSGNLCIDVEDTGPGIREEDQEKIFSEFERLSATQKIEGMGLGLAITRKLVELLGGTMTLESEWGKGSLFRVCFSLSTLAEED